MTYSPILRVRSEIDTVVPLARIVHLDDGKEIVNDYDACDDEGENDDDRGGDVDNAELMAT